MGRPAANGVHLLGKDCGGRRAARGEAGVQRGDNDGHPGHAHRCVRAGEAGSALRYPPKSLRIVRFSTGCMLLV